MKALIIFLNLLFLMSFVFAVAPSASDNCCTYTVYRSGGISYHQPNPINGYNVVPQACYFDNQYTGTLAGYTGDTNGGKAFCLSWGRSTDNYSSIELTVVRKEDCKWANAATATNTNNATACAFPNNASTCNSDDTAIWCSRTDIDAPLGGNCNSNYLSSFCTLPSPNPDTTPNANCRPTNCGGSGVECCRPWCGDGVVDDAYGEECDGDNLGEETCESLGLGARGELSCNPDCILNTSSCGGRCGDGIIDEDLYEKCDGLDLNGETCESLGFTYDSVDWTGVLDCDDNCRFDVSGCILGDLDCLPLGTTGCTADDRCCDNAFINNYFYSQHSVDENGIVVLRDTNQVYWRQEFVDANYIEYFTSWMDNNYWTTGKCLPSELGPNVRVCGSCYDLVSTCTSDFNCCSNKCLDDMCVPITCGDGNCDLGETIENCAQDCSTNCGNRMLNDGENCSNCPSDVKCDQGKSCISGECVNVNSILKFNLFIDANKLFVLFKCEFNTKVDFNVFVDGNILNAFSSDCNKSEQTILVTNEIKNKVTYSSIIKINPVCDVCVKEDYIYVGKEQYRVIPDTNSFQLILIVFIVLFVLITPKSTKFNK